jgi:hypothetical protein
MPTFERLLDGGGRTAKKRRKGRRDGITSAIRDVLSDGKRHAFEEIYDAARRFIRPETAVRVYRSKRWGKGGKGDEIDLTVQIITGTRWVIGCTLLLIGAQHDGDRWTPIWQRNYWLMKPVG